MALCNIGIVLSGVCMDTSESGQLERELDDIGSWDMLRHLGGMVGLQWRSSLVLIAMQLLDTSKLSSLL